MGNELFEQRTRQILYLLGCEDPRHPETDFLLLLIHHIKQELAGNLNPFALSKKNVGSILTSAAHRLIQENAWEEIAGSWHSADIYEALKILIRTGS